MSEPTPPPATTTPDATVLDAQRDHWQGMFTARDQMFGAEPSLAANAALEDFLSIGARDILELGAGQGRDTFHFARHGIRVNALDYTGPGVTAIQVRAQSLGLTAMVTAAVHDVRTALPFADASVDACYSHMLFCMALTTEELERLSEEVSRVLRPGGLHVYTARTVRDPHLGQGIDRGDGMWEMGGFIVHFFDDALVERLGRGYESVRVAEFEESDLPRRLVRVTMRR